MEELIQNVDHGIRTKDYGIIARVFSFGPNTWQAIGQGEQRSLAAHFIKGAVRTPEFLPEAFTSGQMMHVMMETLKMLPSVVEGAADNQLRQMLFDYKVNEDGEYSEAARILAGMRMEDDPNSVYYTTPADKCDVYVKIAECFLEEDEIAESDAAVMKAGGVVEAISPPEEHMVVILRYKSTYARVLDCNRKFLTAASRYHDLSQSSEELIRADDLLVMLGRAATCAILAPSGPQRQRILGLVRILFFFVCIDQRMDSTHILLCFSSSCVHPFFSLSISPDLQG